MGFIQSIDWMQLLRCFIIGGIICIIGQILLDKTKLPILKEDNVKDKPVEAGE